MRSVTWDIERARYNITENRFSQKFIISRIDQYVMRPTNWLVYTSWYSWISQIQSSIWFAAMLCSWTYWICTFSVGNIAKYHNVSHPCVCRWQAVIHNLLILKCRVTLTVWWFITCVYFILTLTLSLTKSYSQKLSPRVCWALHSLNYATYRRHICKAGSCCGISYIYGRFHGNSRYILERHSLFSPL